MAEFEAAEVTAHQAFFLADYLGAGMYPWKLAITGPYVDPAERGPFNERCLAELTEAGVIDDQGPGETDCGRIGSDGMPGEPMVGVADRRRR